MTLDRFDLR